MADIKNTVEDSVQDIIHHGIDLTPVLVKSYESSGTYIHIIKPKNLNAEYLSVTSAVSATPGELIKDLITVTITKSEYTFEHHLDRIPTGYWVVRADKGGDIYDSGTAWTAKEIYLQSDTADVSCVVIIY